MQKVGELQQTIEQPGKGGLNDQVTMTTTSKNLQSFFLHTLTEFL